MRGEVVVAGPACSMFLIICSTHPRTPALLLPDPNPPHTPGASDIEGTGHSDSEDLIRPLAGWSGVCSPVCVPKGAPLSLLHLLFLLPPLPLAHTSSPLTLSPDSLPAPFLPSSLSQLPACLPAPSNHSVLTNSF